MSIKVSFSAGETTVTVSGLYQWDYGRVLEIESSDLGTELMEVHFACSGMSEALVRPCQFVDGEGTVTIPDQCLEQTSTVTAWIYSISSTQGYTVKTIILPITKRVRPSVERDVPPEYINVYAEAVEEINEAVNALEQGEVTAAKATNAEHAKKADAATSAVNATWATNAERANSAYLADKASYVKPNPASGSFGAIEINEGIGSLAGYNGEYDNCILLLTFQQAVSNSGTMGPSPEINPDYTPDYTINFLHSGVVYMYNSGNKSSCTGSLGKYTVTLDTALLTVRFYTTSSDLAANVNGVLLVDILGGGS